METATEARPTTGSTFSSTIATSWPRNCASPAPTRASSGSHCTRSRRTQRTEHRFPNATSVSRHGLWLPSALSLTRERCRDGRRGRARVRQCATACGCLVTAPRILDRRLAWESPYHARRREGRRPRRLARRRDVLVGAYWSSTRRSSRSRRTGGSRSSASIAPPSRRTSSSCQRRDRSRRGARGRRTERAARGDGVRSRRARARSGGYTSTRVGWRRSNGRSSRRTFALSTITRRARRS